MTRDEAIAAARQRWGSSFMAFCSTETLSRPGTLVCVLECRSLGIRGQGDTWDVALADAVARQGKCSTRNN